MVNRWQRWAGRWTGAVAAGALSAGVVVTAGAGFSAPPATGQPAEAASARALATALRALPKVPLPVTDGLTETSLYDRALALSAVGRASPRLQAQVLHAEALISTDADRARADEAAARAATATAAAAAAAAHVAAAQYQALRSSIEAAAVRLYISGGAVAPSPATGDSPQQLLWAETYLDTVVEPRGALRARASALKESDAQTLISAHARAAAAAEAARADALLAAERAVDAGLRARLAAGHIGNAGSILADHQALAAQEAAELTAPTALQWKPAKALPAPLPTTAVAITWAFALLDRPYLWGGTGPAAFDCSGLMQYVWQKAGVTIPRVAAAQDAWTDPVPLSQLLPGDLVFYGTADIHHVGMYIGDGLMINAPHTGTVVQVSSIWWSDLAGFGRVHADGTPVASHQLPTSSHPATKVTKVKKPVPSESRPPAGRHHHPARTRDRAPATTVPPSTTTTIPPTASGSSTTTGPPTVPSTTTTASTTAPSTTALTTTAPSTTAPTTATASNPTTNRTPASSAPLTTPRPNGMEGAFARRAEAGPG